LSQASKQAPPKDSIGGTAACAILGLSSYNGPFSVWSKIRKALSGTLEESPILDGPLLRGIISEDPLLESYSEIFKSETGLHMVELPPEHSVIRHPDFSFIHGTPDRLLMNDEGELVGVLEFKTFDNSSGGFNWRRADYWSQLTHYSWLYEKVSGKAALRNFLMVASAGFGAWSSLVDCLQSGDPYGRASARISIDWREMSNPADTVDKYDKVHAPKLIDFWKSYIEGESVPPVDHTESCRDSFPINKDGPVKLTDSSSKEFVRLVKLRLEHKLKADDATTERKRVENRIIQLLDGHGAAENDNFKVSYKTSKGRKGFKQSLFKKDYPNIHASYIKEGAPSKRLTITEKT